MARADTSSAHNPRWQPRNKAEIRLCAADGCTDAGEYPAPKSKDSLREYQWFCLSHIRAFNSTWNYLQGMNAAEIEAFIRQSTVGERQTQPMGAPGKAYESMLRSRIFREFGAGAEPTPDPDAAALLAGFTVEEIKACRVLALPPTRDFKVIKARYRQLAKQLHPDVNDKDGGEEEKLKTINQAYAVLKAAANPA
jgi:DnaJ-domain-containing protein 1